MRKAGIRTVLLADEGFDDIFRDIEALGLLTGRVDDARALTDRLRARTTALMRTVRPHAARAARVRRLGNRSDLHRRRRVVHRKADNAGRRSERGRASTMPTERTAPRRCSQCNPTSLVADPTVQLQSVLDRPPWNALRAVREHRIAYLPDPAILERPGPRYNDGLAWLIGILNTTHV